MFSNIAHHALVSGRPENLTLADPHDLNAVLAYALRFEDRKRVHTADEIIAEIVAERLVEHIERAGFVILKEPPEIGAAALRPAVCAHFFVLRPRHIDSENYVLNISLQQ